MGKVTVAHKCDRCGEEGNVAHREHYQLTAQDLHVFKSELDRLPSGWTRASFYPHLFMRIGQSEPVSVMAATLCAGCAGKLVEWLREGAWVKISN